MLSVFDSLEFISMRSFKEVFLKLKLQIVVVISLFFFGNVYSQQDDLVIKALELIYSNPDEAIKIAEHIHKNSQENQAKTEASLIIGESYLVKGDFDNAAKNIFIIENQFSEIENQTKIKDYLLKSELTRRLFLDKQSRKYLNKAQELVVQLQDTMLAKKLSCQVGIESIFIELSRRKNREAIGKIQEIEKTYQNFLSTYRSEKINLLIAKEKAYINLGELDTAMATIEELRALIETSDSNDNIYEKALFFKELGYLDIQRKLFTSSETYLNTGLNYAEIIGNQSLQSQIIKDLSLNYLATNQKEKYKEAIEKFILLNNEVSLNEERATNTIYNLITKQQEEIILSNQSGYSKNLKFLLIGVLSLIFIGLFKILRDYEKKKRLREILKYLEITKNQSKKLKTSEKTKTRRVSIPEETEQALLAKLKRFESSKKYLSKDMSLPLLAGQFETNTKYLSEIINNNYNDNFNTFINRLRINYIIEKLKSDPNYINYKISYLAEDCGYSSHSSFATVFKSIVGMSPVTFINLIKEEREKKLQDEIIES